ncbi:unnamed protein product [Hyaloperonospora brassicae]|uniref:FAM86 N-terminal domain-containing protein n=1 Tax=Hyaloperonospora brassicae TaxID=162125 RepID=A0AAV0TPI3_HYABA|nr:unnamed protein product [Hyaloperonospora brassicae]
MSGSDTESDSDPLALSSAALAALQEFVSERGIVVAERSTDVRVAIQKALDTEPQDESFEFTFGANDEHNAPIVLRLRGLRRDIGQTLESTGLTLWRAGDFLSTFLYEHRRRFAGKSILELGSGLGLSGILASYLTEKPVVITDGDERTIEQLVANCRLNNVEQRVQCRKLLWGVDLDQIRDTFDVVLGADVIYEQEHVLPLFETAKYLLKPGRCSGAEGKAASEFLLAYTKRNVSIDYVLATAKGVGFEWEEPTTDEGIYTFRLV